jgi:hypothetical protein
MNRFDSIIFDMEGVIVDSEPRHEWAFREVFEELGYGDRHGMDFATYYGQSDRVFWLDFIAKHRPPQSLDELLSLKLGRLIDILRREQPLFAGLPDLIEKLAPRYRLAIAPGSKHPVIDEVLGMKQLRRFFSVVVSVQEVACVPRNGCRYQPDDVVCWRTRRRAWRWSPSPIPCQPNGLRRPAALWTLTRKSRRCCWSRRFDGYRHSWPDSPGRCLASFLCFRSPSNHRA